jgi:DNA-binding transcriptional ArsR family regulator
MLSGETVPREKGKSLLPKVPIGVESGVGRAILSALGDQFSLRILESAIERGRSVEEISTTEGIPVSTAYRRVHQLTEAGLMILERIVITRAGKKYMIYRSIFSQISVDFEPGIPTITCTPNGGIPDISFRIWQLARKEPNAETTPSNRTYGRPRTNPEAVSSIWM